MTSKTALVLTLGASLLPLALRAAGDGPVTFDASVYGLLSGMTGDVAVGAVQSDVDVGFDKIWDNLDFGAMGKVRVGYQRWSLSTEVIYMKLGASKGAADVDLEQWLVEPTLGYTVCTGFELLAGVRYNNLSGEIRGTGPLGVTRAAVSTQEWWDPIVGANLRLPLGEKWSVNVRGDIGGFGVGSDLTWQAFPYLSWQFTDWGSLQAGYRWVSTDYETGSGLQRFRYDVLTSGPQVGVTVRF